jgi:hypothetical protein
VKLKNVSKEMRTLKR